ELADRRRLAGPVITCSRPPLFALAISAFEHADEIARPAGAVELPADDFFPAGATGAGGAGHTEDHGVVGEPSQGAGLNGGSTDFIKGKLTEQLAETVDGFIEQ